MGIAPIKISLKVRELNIIVELNNSPIAQELVKKLPLDAAASRWGDEIYFRVPAEASAGQVTLDVNIGDVGFFHAGKCLCIFFGRTPASVIDKPVPEAPVELVGRVSAFESLRQINSGDMIKVVPLSGHVPVAGAAPSFSAPAASAAPAPGGYERKLSQGEIDDLVKRLLEERKKAQG